MPFLPSNQQCQSTEGNPYVYQYSTYHEVTSTVQGCSGKFLFWGTVSRPVEALKFAIGHEKVLIFGQCGPEKF